MPAKQIETFASQIDAPVTYLLSLKPGPAGASAIRVIIISCRCSWASQLCRRSSAGVHAAAADMARLAPAALFGDDTSSGTRSPVPGPLLVAAPVSTLGAWSCGEEAWARDEGLSLLAVLAWADMATMAVSRSWVEESGRSLGDRPG